MQNNDAGPNSLAKMSNFWFLLFKFVLLLLITKFVTFLVITTIHNYIGMGIQYILHHDSILTVMQLSLRETKNLMHNLLQFFFFWRTWTKIQRVAFIFSRGAIPDDIADELLVNAVREIIRTWGGDIAYRAAIWI